MDTALLIDAELDRLAIQVDDQLKALHASPSNVVAGSKGGRAGAICRMHQSNGGSSKRSPGRPSRGSGRNTAGMCGQKLVRVRRDARAIDHPHARLPASRLPDRGHERAPAHPARGLGHRDAPDDAPEVSSPSREALIELFDQVRFHPLSIRVLAQQLKFRRPAELGERLTRLLAAHPAGSPRPEDTPPELLASLRLSLDRLDEHARAVLPRLGVFQGGAFEDDLIAITGLSDAQAGQASAVWPMLRRQLESAALVEAETVPGIVPPILRFHPTLAPMLWEQLVPEERTRLTAAHRQRYHQLASFLYNEDRKTPHEVRAIARRELPNLLHAVDAAFAAQDPGAVEFATSVPRFLNVFGLPREPERLTALSQAAAGEEGSWAWYLAQSKRSSTGWATPPASNGQQRYASSAGASKRAAGRTRRRSATGKASQ